jgi:hypothetical protein
LTSVEINGNGVKEGDYCDDREGTCSHEGNGSWLGAEIE